MTRDEIRQALLEDPALSKEVRRNDGRLIILDGAGQDVIAIRNIASIGPVSTRRRRRA